MEKEIWKDIVGYEGFYQVSNLGNVKSLDRIVYNQHKGYLKKGINMVISKNIYGYLQITLKKYGGSNTKKIHRLVAEAFIPNIENKPEVNHINGIKTDNNLNNLEWCTKSENERHKYRVLGYKGTMTGKSSKMRKKINQYDLQGNYIKTWESINQIGTELNFSISSISCCCKGYRKNYGVIVKIKQAYGYIWRYA